MTVGDILRIYKTTSVRFGRNCRVFSILSFIVYLLRRVI